MAKTNNNSKTSDEQMSEFKSSKMTAKSFAEFHGFSEIDRRAVEILHKDKLQPYKYWEKVLAKDFVFGSKN